MSWFNNLSTRAKLFLDFGAMWLLLLVVIFLAYWNITGIAESEKEIYEVGLAKVLKLEELRSGIHYNRAQILEMTLRTIKSEQEEIEKLIRKRSALIDEILENLLAIERDARNQGQLKQIKDILADYRKTREQLLAMVYQGKNDEARKLGKGIQDHRYEKIRTIAGELRQREASALAKRIEQDMQQAKGAIQLFVVFGVAAFLMGLVMILLLNHTIAKPLQAISSVAAQISAGDLTVDLSADSREDEVGTLAQTFRQMVKNLRRSTTEISKAVNQLGAASSEILTATTQVASGTAETASAISETTSTVEEVRQAAQLSKQKADDTSTSTQGVAQVAQTGEKAVTEAAAGMRRIREEMESIAKSIVFLSEKSQSIGGIIATVTGLADQSNLLAVNAAIEAAKAGEQGKGFAVVAQEIKSLAEQSKLATAQVRGILTDIQKATSAAVMATEQGSKAVDAGERQSAQAGETIRALSEHSGRAAQAATQIAVSSQQQVVGMDQVGMAMENINQAGAETAASMKQVETAAQDLNELGQNLKRLVERYKV